MYTLLQWNVLAGFVIQRLAKEAHIDPKTLPSEKVRVARIIKLLKQQDADIINLQEVDNDMLLALVGALAGTAAKYRIIGVMDNNRIVTLDANSVYNNFTTVTMFAAAKFNLIGCRLIDMKTVRPLMRVSLQDISTGRVLHVFNAHFPFSGGEDERYECAEILVYQMKRTVAEFPGLVIFSGDSNLISGAKRTPETLKMIAKNFIIKPDPKTPTYHAWPYERKELQKKTPGALDYIISNASFAIEVIWANMVPFSFPASDHAMLRADFL